jgi:hypothetical protein
MMSAGSMDETISESQPGGETALEPLPPPPPPPVFDTTPWPVTPRPTPRPPRIRGPLGPGLWTVALALALLFTGGGLVVVYIDDQSAQNQVRQLNAQNQALQTQNKAVEAQLTATQSNLTATLGELATVRADLEHPTLGIWTVPQVLKDNTWLLLGGVPDTFTYHLNATSNGPMSVSILSYEDLVAASNCISNGVGNTNWCMHHSGHPAQSWLSVTSIKYDFHLAEGCADYVAVFTTPSTNVTVTPNVSVTYNPASSSTGVCAQSG